MKRYTILNEKYKNKFKTYKIVVKIYNRYENGKYIDLFKQYKSDTLV